MFRFNYIIITVCLLVLGCSNEHHSLHSTNSENTENEKILNPTPSNVVDACVAKPEFVCKVGCRMQGRGGHYDPDGDGCLNHVDLLIKLEKKRCEETLTSPFHSMKDGKLSMCCPQMISGKIVNVEVTCRQDGNKNTCICTSNPPTTN